MNELMLSRVAMPHFISGDFLAASTPFFHADRTVDFNILIYVTAGQINVCEDGTDFDVNPGELLFLKAGVHHWGKREIKPATAWYYIHFGLDTSPCQDLVTVTKKLIGLSGSRLEEQLSQFVKAIRASCPKAEFEQNAALFLLLSACAFHREENRAETLSQKISAYLAENISQPFSAERLEKHFFLSYKYLAAVFKKETGTSMQRYHSAVQMREACSLLKTTAQSVSEIAARLGYQDVLYFSRCFRAKIGVCPTEYRKNATLIY